MPEDIAGFEPSKADPAHQAVSPQAARTRLQFLDTKGLVAPHRFLYLDECLDRFGSKRLGSVWDEIVGLRCFPFQYVSRKRAFYRYRVSRKRPYDRVDRRIVVRGPQRKEFRSASREHKKLLKELSKAIQAEAFKVLLIAPDGQITPIEHLSVFAAQVVRAFYTGTVRITKNDTKHKRWILVDEKSFARWLENGDGPRHRTFGRAIFKPLLPAIAERAALKGYTLVEEPFWDLLDEVARAFEPHLALNDVGFRALWNDDSLAPAKRATPGPRPKADREAFANDRAKLKTFLFDSIQKMLASKQP